MEESEVGAQPGETISSDARPPADEPPVSEVSPPSGESSPLTGEPSAPDAESSALAGVASAIAGAAGPVLSAARRPMGQLASGARRIIDERSGARVRRVRKMGRQPLANVWDLHPHARRASARELGLEAVPVSEIAGTAVEGPAQRGGDFLPLRNRRSDDWRGRWQRIVRAVEGLVDLPPIEVLKFADRYWVVDGHNRVAAALYSGQEAIDAVVAELRLPGLPAKRGPTAIAPYLEGSRDLRAAGSGRLTRTTTFPDVPPVRPVESAAPPPETSLPGEDAQGDEHRIGSEDQAAGEPE
jgi:hypothetical protein